MKINNFWFRRKSELGVSRAIIYSDLRIFEIDLFLERGQYHFECNFFLKRGPNLETRAAHTHPNHSQVPPGGSPPNGPAY